MSRFLFVFIMAGLIGCGSKDQSKSVESKAPVIPPSSPPTIKMPGSNPPALPPPATTSGAFE